VREAFASRRSFALTLLVVALVTVGVPGAGSPDDKASAQKLEIMRRRMESGLALFVAGKYPEAAAEFDAGFADQPYSAFLFNAGVCYQKMSERQKALDRYREYVKVDPNAPDIDTVKRRIEALEAELATPPPPAASALPPTTGTDGGVAAVTPPPPPVVPPPAPPAQGDQISNGEDAMRSLVIVETEPPGAPLEVYLADAETTPAFAYGAANAGWKLVTKATAPTSLSLAVGRYHIVVDKFRDFNVSETDIEVSAGHVHHFKANLSQGAFMSFLRVSANAEGAHVWIDDAKKERPEWGRTPYGELVPSGPHAVHVELAGFQSADSEVVLEHGEQKEVVVRLSRLDTGIVRLDSDGTEATVELDHSPRGVWRRGGPALDMTIASGKHELTIHADGHKDYVGTIDVPKGQVLPVHATLIPKFPRGSAITQAAISGVLFGAGAFLGIESKKLYDQAKADQSAGVLDSGDDRITRGRAYAASADVAFAGSAVLAGLSVYNFTRDPLPPSSVRFGALGEFDDPLVQRPTVPPTSTVTPRGPVSEHRAPSRSSVVVGAAPVSGGAGFVIGGAF
jgi:hypothetical protein